MFKIRLALSSLGVSDVDMIAKRSITILKESTNMKAYRERVKHPCFIAAATCIALQENGIKTSNRKIANSFKIKSDKFLTNKTFMSNLSSVDYTSKELSLQKTDEIILLMIRKGIDFTKHREWIEKTFERCRSIGLLGRCSTKTIAAVLLCFCNSYFKMNVPRSEFSSACGVSEVRISNILTIMQEIDELNKN